ncbi:hypothetical protein GCM10028790_55860 [Micromonospora taraxaci]|uniref:Uncharacterized protein n=1 Tax=Micromonospora taraxaci TaxID=1316803 RepID=A0A561W138_9ACTN|nr:hypothetical protein FHU34_112900 [Micromonospora taraxaci]
MTTHRPTTARLVYGHAQMHDCLAFADATPPPARTWDETRRIRTTHVSNLPSRSVTAPTRTPRTTNRSTSTKWVRS